MIAIVQPFIPNYREDFFKGISETVNTDIYVYEKKSSLTNSNFKISNSKVNPLSNFTILGVLFYSLWPLLDKKYTHLVLILHPGHFTTWILLLTKIFHGKKITIWGQGISVKRYLKEEKSPSFILKVMIALSDVLWVYTVKEQHMWGQVFSEKKIVALNNTISDIERVLDVDILIEKSGLKSKFNINQEICLIFCARFNNNYRRVDLLEKMIQQLDSRKFGFIIIGDGPSKPDFSKYSNVYDYGAVYDRKRKDELFTIADLYFQPGWVGLSIVEAMAYGKPVITYKRSEDVLQCVEYSYITAGFNGFLFEDFDESLRTIENLAPIVLAEMGLNARSFVRENLTMSTMVSNALNGLGINS